MILKNISRYFYIFIVLHFPSISFASDGDARRLIPIGYAQQHYADITIKKKNVNFKRTSEIDYDNYPTKRKAVLLSFLLPGLGEKTIGSHSSAKIFHSSETALWLSLIWNVKVKSWKREDFEVFASANAGVDIDGKDDLYFSNIGGFNNIDDFNAERRRSRDPLSVYSDEEYYWNWSSNEARLKYKSIRFDSERAQLNIEYTIGFLILNRIISVMNTSYRYGKNQMIGRSIESAELKINKEGTPLVSINFKF